LVLKRIKTVFSWGGVVGMGCWDEVEWVECGLKLGELGRVRRQKGGGSGD